MTGALAGYGASRASARGGVLDAPGRAGPTLARAGTRYGPGSPVSRRCLRWPQARARRGAGAARAAERALRLAPLHAGGAEVLRGGARPARSARAARAREGL